MNNNLRERLLRSMLAAVLNSGLSLKELRVVSEQLVASPDSAKVFGELLGDLLTFLPGATGTQDSKELWSRRLPTSKPLPNTKGGKAIGVSQNELRNLIANSEKIPLPTLRSLIFEYLRTASPQEVRRLREVVGRLDEEDPYLKGMSRKR